MPKSQISPLTDFAKLLTANILQLLRKSERSVKICWNLSKSVHCADLRRRTYLFYSLRSLHPLRSLPVNGPALDGRELSPNPVCPVNSSAIFSSSCILHLASCITTSSLSISAKTGKTRSAQPYPYRTKSIVFAKKSLPDFVTISCPSATYRNPESSFFRTFSQVFASFAKLLQRIQEP